MIYSILLISKGGVPIYKKVLRRLPISEDRVNEESLVASIITAVIGMSQEVFGQNVSSFHLENLEVSIGSSEKAIVAVIADRGDKEAIELGRNILTRIDKLLDFPDFEDGLVLQSATERIEKFIDSLMEDISSPITKSISLFEDYLLLMEREKLYERISKVETVTFTPPKKFVSVLKSRILKKEMEILESVLNKIVSGNIEEALNLLTEAFTNSYWGNLARLLYVKIGLIANTLRNDVPAPDINSLLNVINDVKLEDFKKSGNSEEYEKLLILKDNLYKQLTNVNSLEGLANEMIYFRNIKNEFRNLLSKESNEIEKKIFITILTPISSATAPISFINKNWEDLSEYFIENWFMLDRIEVYRSVEYWEDLISRIEDLNRYFYKMKRWSIIAAMNALPLYFDVLERLELVKDVNLMDLKDLLESLKDFWENEILTNIEETLVPSHLVLYAITIGTMIQSYLSQLLTGEKKKESNRKFLEVLEKWAKKIAENYIARRLYPDVLFSLVPRLVYHISILSRESNGVINPVFYLVEEFLNEVKKRAMSEKSKITASHLESIGFVVASIPNYLRFVKNRLDAEKILSRGAELLEYIRTRLSHVSGLGLDKIIGPAIISYYSSIIYLTREKSLADLVLLKAITLSDEYVEENVNRVLTLNKVLELYEHYIEKFGPMVPNWQKPIKECEKTVEILRNLRSPEDIVAMIWKKCQDFRNLVVR